MILNHFFDFKMILWFFSNFSMFFSAFSISWTFFQPHFLHIFTLIQHVSTFSTSFVNIFQHFQPMYAQFFPTQFNTFSKMILNHWFKINDFIWFDLTPFFGKWFDLIWFDFFWKQKMIWFDLIFLKKMI